MPVEFAQPDYVAWAPGLGSVVVGAAAFAGGRFARARVPHEQALPTSLRIGALLLGTYCVLSLAAHGSVVFGLRYALGLTTLAILVLLAAALGAGTNWATAVASKSKRFAERCAWLTATARTMVLGLALTLLALSAILVLSAWKHPDAAHRASDLVGLAPGLLLTFALWLPNLLADLFLAAMGVPVRWEIDALLSVDGKLSTLGMRPALLLSVLPAMLVMLLGARAAATSPARPYRAAVRAGVSFSIACWLLAFMTAGDLAIDPFLGFSTSHPLLPIVLTPLAWGTVGATLGALLERKRKDALIILRPLAALESRAAWWAIPALVMVAASLSVPFTSDAEGSGAAAPAGSRDGRFVPLSEQALESERRRPQPSYPPRVRRGLARLKEDARGGKVIADRDFFGNVGTVLADLPVPGGRGPVGKALSVAERHRELLGLRRPEAQLRPQRVTSELGGRFVQFEQTFRGIPVYRGSFTVALDRGGDRAQLLLNDIFPDAAPSTTTPEIPAAAARDTALQAISGSGRTREPELVVYPEGAAGGQRPQRGAALAWIVDTPSERVIVDALSGRIADVTSLVMHARQRRIYTWDNVTHKAPGIPAYFEGQRLRGGAEVVNIYRKSGLAYDYFKEVHNRDSWNDSVLPFDGGAPIKASANLPGYPREGDRPAVTIPTGELKGFQCPNAAWVIWLNQMAFCKGVSTTDIVGHEYTHAITTYHNQNPGSVGQNKALMESTSDVFGEMVERHERNGSHDWLLGAELSDTDELPIKQRMRFTKALRSLQSPAEEGTRPQFTHMSQMPSACALGREYEAAGIPSSAFYRAAVKLGTERAAKIWYFAAKYVGPLHGFSRMRLLTQLGELRHASGYIAFDDFLKQRVSNTPISNAWDEVGVTNGFSDPLCLALFQLCAARTATSASLDPAGAPEDEVLATLYRMRNEFLPTSAFGEEIVAAYDRHSDRVSELLLADPALRAKAGQLLQDLEPALGALADEQGQRYVLTPELAAEVEGFLWDLRQADVSAGGGRLAETLEAEERLADVESLVGLSFDRVSQTLDQRLQAAQQVPPTP